MRGMAQQTAVLGWFDAMPDCIFDERLKQQCGNEAIQCRRRNVLLDAQLVAKACLPEFRGSD